MPQSFPESTREGPLDPLESRLRGGPGPAESGVWSGALGPAGGSCAAECVCMSGPQATGKARPPRSLPKAEGSPNVPGQGEHVVSGRDDLTVPSPCHVRGSRRPAAAEGGRGPRPLPLPCGSRAGPEVASLDASFLAHMRVPPKLRENSPQGL